MKMLIVAGTRPEIIKLFPVIKELEKKDISYKLIWTGQHYDKNLFEIFFKEFNLRKPDYNLKIGSGSHAKQTYKIMYRIEKILNLEKPNIVVVQGDTNSCMAAALTSVKMKIPVAHVEAGLRSFDMRMPEEINRIIVDHISQALFAPTKISVTNLICEGIEADRIFLTGNTIVDTVNIFKNLVDKYARYKEYEDFLLLTIHREENVENEKRLKTIFNTLLEVDYKIVFPIHPRTKKALKRINLYKKIKEKIIILEPLGYMDFLYLLKKCKAVITDSGGVQEEALILKKPCITIRENTERIESILMGCNILTGYSKKRILNAIYKALELKIDYNKNPLGDGKAGERIVKILTEREFNIRNINFLKHNFIRRVRIINEETSIKSFEKKYKCKINKILRKDKILFPHDVDKLKPNDLVEFL